MRSLASYDVVVVGSVHTDLVLTIDHRPAPGETVAASTCSILPGGKGANQAVAATRCGARVALVAKVGRDPLGERRLEELQGEGIDLRYTSVADAPTGLAVVSVAPDGENTIMVAPGANARLGSGDVAAAAEALASAGVMLGQLEVPLPAVRRAVSLSKGRALVVLNAAPYHLLDRELLEGLDVLVVNAVEAERLAGAGRARGGPTDLARHLRELGPGAVVVTLGADGAVSCDRRSTEHLPAPAVEVVDTTGAGDAFVGTLATRLSGGATLHDAVAAGIAAGTATAAHLGAAPQIPDSLRSGGT